MTLIDPTQPEPAVWPETPGAWLEMARSLAADAHALNPRIVFLGDSITQGWGSDGRAEWETRFAPLGAANLGIGGDRTQNILWRIADGALDGLSPELVVLKIGVNNLWEEVQHCGPDKVADGVAAIVAAIRAHCPDAKILVLGILPTQADPSHSLRAIVRAVNARNAALVPTPDGQVRFADIGSVFLEADGTISTDIMPDGCHLSPRGYGLFADAIEPLLHPILGSQPTRDTDWFLRKQWGLFVHYLPDGADFDRLIAGFDVAGLVAQLKELDAGYFVFTMGQNNGYYNAPNSAYDSYVNYDRPSTCAKRDLAMELSEALRPHGIPLFLYMASNAPEDDRTARERLEWDKFEARNAVFHTRWQEMLREWSLRYGDRIAGWWMDGCWGQREQFEHPETPNWASFASALRAGNPNSLLAFNPGWVQYGDGRGPIFQNGPEEDYTAGEINDPPDLRLPTSRWIGTAQFHVLSYQAGGWSTTEGDTPRYSDDEFIALSQSILDKQGVITWDVPQTLENGLLAPACLTQLRVWRDHRRAATKNTTEGKKQ